MIARSSWLRRVVTGCTAAAVLVVGVGYCAAAAAGGRSSSEAAAQLARRVVPALAKQIQFETIPADHGHDVFEVESRGKRLVLRGNNGVAMASALNRYLEQYAHADISWNCGDQLALPATPPRVDSTLRVESPHVFRYAYNFCTHGYTMAWWHWPEWERELDFLALKGVNLALVIQGEEQVWITALAKFGYSEAEVRAWLCAPSHQPWQYMSNIEYYGGPLSQELVRGRAELGRRIVGRMCELGIEPVLQGYYGIVPSDFKTRFPQAKVHPQGEWAGLKRPDMLDPLDPMFAEVARAFYEAQTAVFGPAKFFDADPFHEGGSTTGIDLAAAGRAIYDAMARSNPNATWVLQSWLENPRQPMIDALDKSHLLVLDLSCEAKENWRLRNQFNHTPWLWCTIQNYGGNVGLGSNLGVLRERPTKALAEAGEGRGEMRGIGALMEGSQTQPVVWELFFDHAWEAERRSGAQARELQASEAAGDESRDLETWLRDYARRRYGVDDAAAFKAWQILRATVYAGGDGSPLNSVICARPTLDPYPKARFWGTTRPDYDTTKLVAAWRSLLDAAPTCARADGYRYDLVDVTRQVLADLAGRYHRDMLDAYAKHDAPALEEKGKRMLELLSDVDQLLATRREFMLGPWLASARSWGATPEEKDRYEQDARELVTTWNSHDSITDYANRQWSGVVGDFYAARWKLWIAALQRSLATNTPLDEKRIQAEMRENDLDWTKRHNGYPSEPAGDAVATARRLYERYAADASMAEASATGSSASAP